MASILAHFEALTERGLKVIPLWENSKTPMCKGWTNHWDKESLRAKIKQFPQANLGILLGDIIDVEGDNEEANRTILNLIGDYKHPSYISTKSIHHLFVNPDKDLRHFRYGEIEFRGHGHQSVIPPSQHEGVAYRWLSGFSFPVPEMPERLRDFYFSKKNGKRITQPGLIQVWCIDCREKCILHEKRFKLELEAFRIMGLKWQCRDCRAVDLRAACRMIRKTWNVKSTK